MRSGFFKALVLFSLSVILLGMPLLLSPNSIRPSRFGLVKYGMTEAQIEEILGATAGDYDGYRSFCARQWTYPYRPEPNQKWWCSRHGALHVWFDEQGRVEQLMETESEPATWWAMLWHRFAPRQQVHVSYVY
jgi:hypothetical protein